MGKGARMSLDQLGPTHQREAMAQIVKQDQAFKGKSFTVYILPMGKPRMTQRDKWDKRPAVMRYWAFKDEMRAQVSSRIPLDTAQLSWLAVFPIPKSWTKMKKEELKGELHRQRPDRDNIDKAILDALFKEDSGIAKGTIEKIWDDGGGPRIELSW